MKISSNREIAIVQADYLALANDLEQAQALASSLEMELSGKTNELARFKVIWERTQGDLTKFERDMEALRQERHILANEAQRGRAFELKFQKAQAAIDELTAKVERLSGELTREREAHEQSRALLTTVQKDGGRRDDLRLRQTLEELRAQIDRALSRTGDPVGTPAEPPKAEHIEIEFSM
jgi:chromosome segregation ATPase